MAKILKKLSARRLRTNASSIPSQVFESSFIEALDAVLPIVSLPLLTNARGGAPSPITDSQDLIKDTRVEPMDSAREVVNAAIESVMEAIVEVVSAIFSVPVVAETGENLPDETTETRKWPVLLVQLKGSKLSNHRGQKFLFLMLNRD